MDQLNSAFDEKLGLEITKATAEEVRGQAPIAGNTQPAGRWHGGASAAMIETLGSIGASEWAGDGKVAVGTELSVSHLKGARGDYVQGVANARHLGPTSAVYTVELTDSEDRLIAIGRLTCRLISA